jgi:hypothetical protein
MKIYTLFPLFLALIMCNNKGTHHVNSTNASQNNKTMYEIVICLRSGINLGILDNRFVADDANNKDKTDEFNNIIEKFEAKINKLKGKVELGNTQEIYYILTDKEPEVLVKLLSKQTALVESVYIKPPAEDPGG